MQLLNRLPSSNNRNNRSLSFNQLIVVFLVLIFVVGLAFLLATVTNQTVTNQLENNSTKNGSPTILVLPHHDLIANKFDQFYQTIPLKRRNKIKRVVLLAPNHNFPEKTTVTNEIENAKQDHAVGLHLDPLARFFPNAEIQPLLITRHVTEEKLDEMIKNYFLQKDLSSTLVVASVDFSHGLNEETAKKNDQQTLKFIYHNQEKEILSLDDTYLDCPGCLYTTMQLASKHNLGQPKILFNSTANDFIQLSADEPTTTYLVLLWIYGE